MSIEFKNLTMNGPGTYYPPYVSKSAYGKDYDCSPFTRERLGVPLRPISHGEFLPYIEKMRYKRQFYLYRDIPKEIPFELRQHMTLLKNKLFVYERMVEKKVFSIEELYERCLNEGPAFAKFIKKSRAFSLQYRESIEGIEESEYTHEEYSGYNSIFHERDLIHWDEAADTCDFPYSLMEPFEDFPEDDYENIVRKFLNKFKLLPYLEDDTISIIESATNRVSATNSADEKKATTLLKNTWSERGLSEPWMATRTVINIDPANCRDAAVPDISTLHTLKVINKHARVISEAIPFMADCSGEQMLRRIARLSEKSKWFFHLDFKKYGLSTDRRIGNTVLSLLNKENYKIPDSVYLNIGKETIITKRGGGALGWCDPIFAIGIAAILHTFKKKWGSTYDFLVFKDDVEIGFNRISADEALLRKELIFDKLEQFGMLLSYRKCYISRRMIFLEEYHPIPDEENDMEKLSLAVKQYGISLSTQFEWEAKYYFSRAYMKFQEVGLTEACINPWKRDNLDPMRPYEVGGWIVKIDPFCSLNAALEDATEAELRFYHKLRKYKRPDLMPKYQIINPSEMRRAKERRYLDAYYRAPRESEIQLDESRRADQDELGRLELYHESEEETMEIPPVLPARRRVEPTGPGPPD